MCLGEGISKAILVILNIVFFLLGLGLIILGAILLTDSSTILEYLGKLPLDTTVIEEGIYGSSWLYNFAYMMLAAGGFFFLVGGAGLFGACCKARPLLVIYGTVLFMIIALEIAIGVLAILYGNQVKTYLLTFLATSITKYYIGLSYVDGTITMATDSTGISAAWDYAQVQFDCCGANNMSDYESADSWPGYYTYDGVNVTAAVPLTCCMISDKTGWPTDPSSLTFTNITTCLSSADASSTNTDGCYDSIYNKLKQYSTAIIVLGCVIGAIELLGLWGAVSLYRAINRNKVDVV